MLPLSILTAEKMPECFQSKMTTKCRKSFFSRGFAGNGLILLWTVVASFISMAFHSNIRAMLMIPVYEDPIDTTEDLFERGKIPIIGPEGGYWREYLLGSNVGSEKMAGGSLSYHYNFPLLFIFNAVKVHLKRFCFELQEIWGRPTGQLPRKQSCWRRKFKVLAAMSCWSTNSALLSAWQTIPSSMIRKHRNSFQLIKNTFFTLRPHRSFM